MIQFIEFRVIHQLAFGFLTYTFSISISISSSLHHSFGLARSHCVCVCVCVVNFRSHFPSLSRTVRLLSSICTHIHRSVDHSWVFIRPLLCQYWTSQIRLLHIYIHVPRARSFSLSLSLSLYFIHTYAIEQENSKSIQWLYSNDKRNTDRENNWWRGREENEQKNNNSFKIENELTRNSFYILEE